MDDLVSVKGIGPKTAGLFNRLNIYSVNDLVTHYPYRYDVLRRDDLNKIEDPEQKIVVDGIVESYPVLLRFRGGKNKLSFRFRTVNKVVGVTIFGRGFLKDNLSVGTKIIVLGKFDKNTNIIIASDIKFGVLGNKERIESVYRLTSGISQKIMSNAINNALLYQSNLINDSIPKHLINKYDFLNKKTSLNIIHNPPNYEKMKEASIRLKYEELFEFMFKINYSKMMLTNNTGIEKKTKRSLNPFIKKLPFTLTNDQEKVLKEIIDDLASTRKMNRLLQGDVGSGKTVISVIAMYYTKLCGFQSALMVPTEVLAFQHFDNMKKMFEEFDVNIELLTGSTTKKEKKRIYEGLEDGSIDIVIGTHALIQENVVYNNLGLVVTDEQQRFGVNQRANLKNKGLTPDVLYMSATPIPRTYALTIYGDMDISIISEKPKGRLPIETKVFNTKDINKVYHLMKKELEEKRQIYVISPLIEESETLDLTNVYMLRDKMNILFGNLYSIDIVHGKMKSKEKDEIMKKFKDNEVNILISTTVIEVGVDVSNATMMVIFDANRFGLSTLHQLRGRVGRSNIQSQCLLISNTEEEARLKVMEKTNDGFEISEEDFKLRGSGDLFGTKQSGDMTFKIANLKNDYKILIQTKKDSYEYLNDEKYDNEEIKKRLIESIKSL